MNARARHVYETTKDSVGSLGDSKLKEQMFILFDNKIPESYEPTN